LLVGAVEELGSSETVLAPGLAAAADSEALGSGSKVRLTLKTGELSGQPPPELAAPVPPPFVEDSSVTSATPSIRRSRCSIWATAFWLVAQPLMSNVGTLPAGVAEDTELVDALVVEALLDEELDDEELLEPGFPAVPTSPLRAVTET
jgi:hypothetical protein